jgi:hypothetical protein
LKNGGRTWGHGGLDSPRRSLDVRKKVLIVFNNVSNIPFRGMIAMLHASEENYYEIVH